MVEQLANGDAFGRWNRGKPVGERGLQGETAAFLKDEREGGAERFGDAIDEEGGFSGEGVRYPGDALLRRIPLKNRDASRSVSR